MAALHSPTLYISSLPNITPKRFGPLGSVHWFWIKQNGPSWGTPKPPTTTGDPKKGAHPRFCLSPLDLHSALTSQCAPLWAVHQDLRVVNLSVAVSLVICWLTIQHLCSPSSTCAPLNKCSFNSHNTQANPNWGTLYNIIGLETFKRFKGSWKTWTKKLFQTEGDKRGNLTVAWLWTGSFVRKPFGWLV